MYSATLFLFLSMWIVLGSFISFVILLSYIPIISKRMRNEEKVLEEGLVKCQIKQVADRYQNYVKIVCKYDIIMIYEADKKIYSILQAIYWCVYS